MIPTFAQRLDFGCVWQCSIMPVSLQYEWIVAQSRNSQIPNPHSRQKCDATRQTPWKDARTNGRATLGRELIFDILKSLSERKNIKQNMLILCNTKIMLITVHTINQ